MIHCGIARCRANDWRINRSATGIKWQHVSPFVNRSEPVRCGDERNGAPFCDIDHERTWEPSRDTHALDLRVCLHPRGEWPERIPHTAHRVHVQSFENVTNGRVPRTDHLDFPHAEKCELAQNGRTPER